MDRVGEIGHSPPGLAWGQQFNVWCYSSLNPNYASRIGFSAIEDHEERKLADEQSWKNRWQQSESNARVLYERARSAELKAERLGDDRATLLDITDSCESCKKQVSRRITSAKSAGGSTGPTPQPSDAVTTDFPKTGA